MQCEKKIKINNIYTNPEARDTTQLPQILQITTLPHRSSNTIPNLRPQLLKPLDNPIPITLTHLLTHLELPLQPLNPNLDPNNILLQQLHIVNRRIRHLPRSRLLTTRISHDIPLRLSRQILNLLLQEGACLFSLGIAVYANLAVRLHG